MPFDYKKSLKKEFWLQKSPKKLQNKENLYENGFNIDTSFTEELPEEAVPEEPTAAKELVEWLDVLCFAIILIIVLFTFIFRVATIEGDSMLNTLHNGDRVIMTNWNYEPNQGDIVVVSRNMQNSTEGQESSEEPIIKRVIAVGGQTVDIDYKKHTVYVDGKALDEEYLGSPTINNGGDVKFPIYVPEGHIFVLVDNRSESMDSRFSKIGKGGLIDNRYVLGHVVYRFFPFDKIGVLD